MPVTSLEDQSSPSKIACCALNHYHRKLPKKGKPKPGEEWTVYAAIVAFHRIQKRMWVVSCATGTKCTAQRHNGCILHDSHAEVLARRGLIRVILAELMAKEDGCATKNSVTEQSPRTRSGSHALLVERKDSHDESNKQLYQMNPDIELHFYISDSPCGDASIYSVPADDSTTNNNGILYTGAKVIVSKATKVDATDCGGKHQLLPASENKTASGREGNGKETGSDGSTTPNNKNPVFAREEVQVLGKLRIKSGRSNLPAHMRSHSHSCSDKLASWSVLGMQGGWLTRFLDPPIIPLTSVVVSRDSRLHNGAGEMDANRDHEEQYRPQQIALERAIPGRVQSTWNHLGASQKGRLPSWKPPIPTVHVVPQTFVSGKAAMMVPPPVGNSSTGKKRKQSGGSGGNHAFENRNEHQTPPPKPKSIPPCGMCLNWNQTETECIEVLVGARGIQQGKKPKTPDDIEKLASRLSRARLLREHSSFLLGKTPDIHCTACTAIEEERSSPTTMRPVDSPLPLPLPPHSPNSATTDYQQIKRDGAHREWSSLKTRLLTDDKSPFAGWLRCVPTTDDETA
eukprot:jgi/Psemu1/264503/estExt_Genewise1Plus.C_18090004